VANGTPEQLKGRSAQAGAVVLRVRDESSDAVVHELRQLAGVDKCVVLEESPLTVRALAKKNGQPGDLARAIAELAAREKWRIEELHTEEGRLDEVFRSITRPEMKQEEAA